MSDPVDLVLSRLEGHGLRQNGADRWRSCCPGHNGSNRSALSIGRGQNGSVLLKCWQGCEVDQIAAGLGLTMEDLFPPREASAGPMKRRRLLTSGQALELLDDEMTVAAVSLGNWVNGMNLTEADWNRFVTAAARIATLRQECRQ